MFDAIPPSTNKQPLQTPCRPPQSDLLISFETPAPNSLNAQPPTTRKTLLDIDDLFVPQTSDYNEEKLAELITSTLESERQKWQREVEMRHSVELETLAADLHAQYREKHTRKVEALKVTYKRQYEKKINSLEERVKELEGQLEEVRGELERERVEKRELIEMSEELMRLTAAQTVGENWVKVAFSIDRLYCYFRYLGLKGNAYEVLIQNNGSDRRDFWRSASTKLFVFTTNLQLWLQ